MSLADQVQAIVDGGEEADEILRASLAVLHEATGAPWSAIAFVEEREIDSSGASAPARRDRRCPR